MRVVAFRGTGLHFKVVDVAAQGLRQLVDELCHAEGPHLRSAGSLEAAVVRSRRERWQAKRTTPST